MDLHLPILFNRLNDSAIRYCLLTDFESDFASGDIDLFVDPDDRTNFEKTLLDLGWRSRKEPAHHVNHHFYHSPDTTIYLDIKYDLSFANGPSQCFTYKHPDRVLSRTVLNSRGVARPQGTDAIILYAAHLAFKERGKLEEKHRIYLTEYLDRYRPESTQAVGNTISAISDWLSSSFPADLAQLQLLLAPYFQYERKKMVRSRKMKYGFGVKVLFLGTDGSGKTTLVEEVTKHLNLKTNKLYLGTGEKGWTFKFFKKFYEYKLKSRLLSRILGFLKVYIVLPIEYTLRILPVKLDSRYRVTLIDRYPGSVFLEDRPKRIAYYKLILPKPDIIFFLYANPEDLVKRKPDEITLESSTADIKKFRKVAEVLSDGKYKEINTSHMGIQEARDYIISEIYRHPKTYNSLLTPSLQQVHQWQ